MTRVVNIRDGQRYDIYIGRANPRYSLPRSKWANPYRITRNSTPERRLLAIANYRDYVLARPDLIAALPELRGRVLGCWCAPLPCHGDALVDLSESGEQ